MILLGMIGGTEIIVILLVVLILFGGKKIPELMRGLGKGVKEYKNAMNGIEKEINNVSNGGIHDASDTPGNTEVSSAHSEN